MECRDVAVLGAAGKMGSGISLLLLQKMILEKMQNRQIPLVLRLVDVNEEGFTHLRTYLEEQILKFLEKNIIFLREAVKNIPDLISNKQIIDFSLKEALHILSFTTDLSTLKNSELIFEAVKEDLTVKVDIFKKITSLGNKKAFFFSNTSSIPIHVIAQEAGIEGHLIGYHFYNPPVVQKLLEIIIPKDCSEALVKIAYDLAKDLKKTVVISEDIAGFIGNGHMIREMAFACREVEDLQKTFSLEQSIYIVNEVTEKWLIRPMGIFQLMDFVGLDVCLHIATVMSFYLKDDALTLPLLEKVIKAGHKGGQLGDSVQKQGFFDYEKNRIVGIYSFEKKQYIPLQDLAWKKEIDEKIFKSKQEIRPFHKLYKDPNKKIILEEFLHNLSKEDSLGGKLAQTFLKNSQNIIENLVKDKVAKQSQDVDTVLLNGFYHLYGSQV